LKVLHSELIATAVTAFLVSVPCLIFLLNSRWQDWAEVKRNTPIDEFGHTTIRQDLA
jgi:hypothetical protein